MREIKFRVWSTKNNKAIMIPLTFFNAGDLIQEKDWIVMQYTGLKDNDDVEIYEGDIVRGRYENEVEIIVFGNIGYDGKWNGLTGFTLKSWESKHWETHESDGFYELEYHFEPEELEVVGNIYENPELLK